MTPYLDCPMGPCGCGPFVVPRADMPRPECGEPECDLGCSKCGKQFVGTPAQVAQAAKAQEAWNAALAAEET